jgi:hypothetical protein
MCGTIGTARQAGVPARHAVRQPGTTVRIPPLTDPHGNDLTGRWPLRSFLELGALPSAVPCARLHTRQLAWEWQLTGLSEDAELVVSEIMTNAIQINQADGRTARYGCGCSPTGRNSSSWSGTPARCPRCP